MSTLNFFGGMIFLIFFQKKEALLYKKGSLILNMKNAWKYLILFLTEKCAHFNTIALSFLLSSLGHILHNS